MGEQRGASKGEQSKGRCAMFTMGDKKSDVFKKKIRQG
jgi:hypothetical protein